MDDPPHLAPDHPKEEQHPGVGSTPDGWVEGAGRASKLERLGDEGMSTTVRDVTIPDQVVVLDEARDEPAGISAVGLLRALAAGGDTEAREALAFLTVLQSQPSTALA